MSLFKKFMSYYKPYRGLFVLDMVCVIFLVIIDLAFPQILRYFTNGLFTMGSGIIMKYIYVIAVALFVMYVLRAICKYIIASWGHIMGARMETDMRRDLFDQYQRLSFSYYDKNNTGEMMSRLISDLFDISELAHHGPENIFISVFKLTGSFILLMLINVPLTLILLFVTFMMLIFCMHLNGEMQETFTDNRKKIAGVARFCHTDCSL